MAEEGKAGRGPWLAKRLSARLPFHYSWVILGCVCLAGFARQGPAVAVLSIFVEPMRRDLGWSSTAFGAAVALGGVLAALVSPVIGRVLDRSGARAVLLYAVVSTALATMAISLIDTLLGFYLLYCFARMNWAVPFDLGLYGALNSWFVARRAWAASIATVAQLAGLVTFPLLAHLAIGAGDWRTGWIAVGLGVLVVGFLPVWLLLVHRPEDVGLAPQGLVDTRAQGEAPPLQYTRAQALRTPAFWLLALFTALVFPCQAGINLYQASHMLERGIPPGTAAAVVSVTALMSAIASFGVGWLPRRWPIRYALAGCGAFICAAALIMLGIQAPWQAYLGASLIGLGIGGMLALLPVVWADYFGRESYGAIRGAALSLQVLAQACGPILAGVLHDLYGDYTRSLALFVVLAALGVVAALAARKPGTHAR